jgi:hypothetical protein
MAIHPANWKHIISKLIATKAELQAFLSIYRNANLHLCTQAKKQPKKRHKSA